MEGALHPLHLKPCLGPWDAVCAAAPDMLMERYVQEQAPSEWLAELTHHLLQQLLGRAAEAMCQLQPGLHLCRAALGVCCRLPHLLGWWAAQDECQLRSLVLSCGVAGGVRLLLHYVPPWGVSEVIHRQHWYLPAGLAAVGNCQLLLHLPDARQNH